LRLGPSSGPDSARAARSIINGFFTVFDYDGEMPNPPLRFADDEIRKRPADPWFARAILFGILLLLMTIVAQMLYPAWIAR